ncbi:hypothetical protein EGJ52_24275 [Pseudomonas luteola]|nr:hypothetical protein EGJ52_24275 [Pseudomonas luteola]
MKNKELGPLQTCWEIGLHIIEFDPGQVAPRVFAKDFDEHKLQVSYQEFSIWNAVRTELSWTYFLLTKDASAALPILNGNEQLFASKYKLLRPNEEIL